MPAFRLALLALAITAQAELAIPPLAFTERTLPNGLRVIALEDRSAPVVAIQVWYRVGGKDDPPGRSGFAHLFEHMMFKSTRRMPSETLDRLTEDVGGENNAYTADDVTVYHEVVPANHLPRLLWAEAERLAALNVDARNFTLEREVVKEEYRQSVLAEPFGEFFEFIPKQSFAAHPYRQAVIGDLAQLDAATLEEVRAFHATYYRPDNATLVVVGDFDPAALDRWVEAWFAPIPRPAGEIPRVAVKEPARTMARTVRQFDEKVPFPALAVTYLGPSVASEDRAAWEVLGRVLGGGEASRLYRSLVYEQQLAQSAEFSADLREDLGLPTFSMVLASGVKVEKARGALLAEIARVAREPVSDRELTTAKNQLLAARLHERETVLGRAEALGRASVLLGGAAVANRELADLQAVTAERVQAIARAVFTEENQLVIEYLPANMKPRTP